jgi:probable HAF family extracellular repeat protein
MTELNTLVGGNYSVAAGINNSGWVVGTSSISDDQGDKFRAVIWQNGNITNLGTLGSVHSGGRGTKLMVDIAEKNSFGTVQLCQ